VKKYKNKVKQKRREYLLADRNVASKLFKNIKKTKKYNIKNIILNINKN